MILSLILDTDRCIVAEAGEMCLPLSGTTLPCLSANQD
uniref:Uncharacterized protein n=1 Tax=Siphoviridae sp. ctLeG9 TaxID=2827848 RepID=A0A8S5RV54_9CAUD|nr:MAG TPA: hypothetical protein [Siphoviridae sp. ctLeG9]